MVVGSHDVASFGGFFDFLDGFVDHGKLHLGDVELAMGLSRVVEEWVHECGGAGFMVGAEEFW